MRTATTGHGLVLAVHFSRKGFGWAAFDGPFVPADWGLAAAHKDKNLVCLRKIEQLLLRLSPHTLVLEALTEGPRKRSSRICHLYRAVADLAANRGIDVAAYTRGDIAVCFATVGARTRQEIAEAIVRHNEIFRRYLTAPRRPWQDEQRGMQLFSAVALVVTHFRMDVSKLFEEFSES